MPTATKLPVFRVPEGVDVELLRRPVRAPKAKADIETPELEDYPHWHNGPCKCTSVVVYLRVSSEGGRERIISPMLQFEAIEADCRRRNRRIVAIYFDLKSGTSLEGRMISTVVREIQEGQYPAVAVYNWSRWGRSLLESVQMCKLVDDAGGQVVSAMEAFKTSTPSGKLLRNIMLAIAEHQSETIGENWQGIQARRRKAGLPHTGRDRVGYVYIQREYYVDPVEAQLLADTYQRYVDGVSLRQLVREWNALGIRTTRGGTWTPQALGRVLDTGFAAGYIRERSVPTGEPANCIIGYDVWREGGHDRIIDEDLWQQYRAKREAQSRLPVRLRSAVHDVSGLVFCILCARRMNAKNTGRDLRRSWLCGHKASYHPDASVMISDAMLVKALRTWITDRIGQGDAAAVTAEAQRLEDAAPAARAASAEILAKIRDIDRRRDGVGERQEVDRKFTKAKAKARYAELDADEAELRTQLMRAKAAEKMDDPTQLLPAFKALDEHWDDFTPTDRNAALREVVGMIQVSPYSTVTGERSTRVRVVPAWEMADWGDSWLASLRRR